MIIAASNGWVNTYLIETKSLKASVRFGDGTIYCLFLNINCIGTCKLVVVSKYGEFLAFVSNDLPHTVKLYHIEKKESSEFKNSSEEGIK